MGTFENLNEKFDLPETAIVVHEPEVLTVIDTLPNDSETARTTIHELIGKGMGALDGVLNVAKQSDSPRAYEVAANLLKTMSELSKDLLEVQQKAKELNEPSKQQGPTTQNNFIFAGSTHELMRAMKQAQGALPSSEEVPAAEFEVVKE